MKMDENSTSTIEFKFGNNITKNPEITDSVIVSSNVIESNLFNGYTWQGWLTMTICFLGATANIFHVSYLYHFEIDRSSEFRFYSHQILLESDTILMTLF